MQRAPLPLLMALAAAPLFVTSAASAQSVRLNYGMPLGSFTATPSGQSAAPHTQKATRKQASRPVYAKQATTERRKPAAVAGPVTASAPQTASAQLREDAATSDAPKVATTAIEPQKVETTKEADAPTTVASHQNATCRKFIATAGTTIEVPCAAASD